MAYVDDDSIIVVEDDLPDRPGYGRFKIVSRDGGLTWYTMDMKDGGIKQLDDEIMANITIEMEGTTEHNLLAWAYVPLPEDPDQGEWSSHDNPA